jgi:hypothetical protein
MMMNHLAVMIFVNNDQLEIDVIYIYIGKIIMSDSLIKEKPTIFTNC